MTGKEKECLDFIEAYFKEHGIPPSYDEMNDGLGLNSKSGIHRIITALEKKGHIKRLPHFARTIQLVENDNWQHIGELAQKVVKSMSIEHINDNGEGTVEVDAKAFGELDIAISENSKLSVEGTEQ